METGKTLTLLALGIVFLAAAASADYLDTKWTYQTKAMVKQVYIDDIDNDGLKEVIVGATEEKDLIGTAGWLYAVNRDGKKIWEYNNIPGIASMLVDDLNNDGQKEVILGIANNIFFINGKGEKTANLQISTPNQFGVINDGMLAEDIDNDRAKELIVGANSNGGGKIFVYEPSHVKKWDHDIKEKVNVVYAADINSDDLKEIIVGTNGKGGDLNKPAKVYALDPVKGTELWSFDTIKGVYSLAVSDVDSDGFAEIIVGCQDHIYILNGKGQEKKSVDLPSSPFCIKVADLDKSGNKYILVGSNDVYALDKDLNKRWKAGLNNMVYGIEFADVDGDGRQEILVESDKFYVLNKDNQKLFELSTRLPVVSLATADLYDDNSTEVAVGSLDSYLYLLQSKTQAKMLNATIYFSQANSLILQEDYSDARIKLSQARKIYSDLNKFADIKNCDNLYTQINNAEAQSNNKKAEADQYYNKSYIAFMAHDYRNATMYAKQAESIYPLNAQDGKDRCNNIIDSSTGYLKDEADSNLENAIKLYDNKDYSSALAYALKANDSYKFLKDDNNLNKTLEFIARIRSESGDLPAAVESSPAQSSDNTTLIIVGIIVAALLVISAWAIRKAKKKIDETEDKGLEEDEIIDDVEKDLKKQETIIKKEARKKLMQEEQARQNHSPEIKTPNKKDHSEAHHRAEQKNPKDHETIRDILEKRKELPKIAKDSFRGHGFSMKNLMNMPEKEEDIAD